MRNTLPTLKIPDDLTRGIKHSSFYPSALIVCYVQVWLLLFICCCQSMKPQTECKNVNARFNLTI